MRVNYVQGSDEWHAWRKEGLGSSDAPAIMGVSPWKTRTQLWREKTTGEVEGRTSLAMQRGLDLEPAARAWASKKLGIDFQPACFQNDDRPWLRASFDGISPCGKIGIEIKCPGEQDHATAKKGHIPKKYTWQLNQHRLVHEQLEEHYYLSFFPLPDDKEDHIILPHHRDEGQLQMLLKEMTDFWTCCRELLPPQEGVRDGIQMDDERWLQMAEEYADVETQLERLEGRKKNLRDALCHHLGEHRRIIGGGLVITRQERTGHIDYAQVPQLQGMDLEKYRKGNTFSYQIRIARPENAKGPSS